MGLMLWERRSLAAIDAGLSGRDPVLSGKFALFNRLAAAERMPRHESLPGSAVWLLVLVMIVAVGVVLAGVLSSTPRPCSVNPCPFHAPGRSATIPHSPAAAPRAPARTGHHPDPARVWRPPSA